jgi:small subunit ribosomal protein S18
MARGGGGGGDRERRRGPKDSGRRPAKKKVCIFCSEHVEWVDYKDVSVLRRFMSDRGKIRARRVSGNCAQHQRDVAIAIKTARELALLPYSQRTVAERGGGRRGGREAPERAEVAAVPDEAEQGAELEGIDLGEVAEPEAPVEEADEAPVEAGSE